MAHKNVVFRAKAREKILRGAGALADGMKKIGAMTVEEAKTTETAMEVVEGMQFDRGGISPCK